MAITPERNDVDISKLFKWSTSFPLVNRFNNPLEVEGNLVLLYLRLCGDAEINRARTFAIRKSAELRRKLKTGGTDEREAFISTIYEVDDNKELVEMIASARIREFAQEAQKVVNLPFPKEPKTEAELEEVEKFQAEVDSYPKRREEAIGTYVLQRVVELQESLKQQSLEYLQKEYEKLFIAKLCEQEMIEKFKEFCCYLGSFRDPEFKVPFFTNFEEFDNLPTETKNQIVNQYSNLEVNINELKKSLEAMQ